MLAKLLSVYDRLFCSFKDLGLVEALRQTKEYSLEPNKQYGILLTRGRNSTYIVVYILSRTKQHNRESERDREIPAKSVLALTSRLD